MAKCNLGKVHLKSTRPAVFLTNMLAGWLQKFALPCDDESAVFASCYSFAIIAVLLQSLQAIFYPAPPSLVGSLSQVSTVLGKYFH